MSDFVVRIPRTSVAVSEATLNAVLVPDGEQVESGQPLFTIETEKVETEVDAGASGTVRWTAQVGETYDTGTEIGVIESA